MKIRKFVVLFLIMTLLTMSLQGSPILTMAESMEDEEPLSVEQELSAIVPDTPYHVELGEDETISGSFTAEKTGIYALTCSSFTTTPSYSFSNQNGYVSGRDSWSADNSTRITYLALQANETYSYTFYGSQENESYDIVLSLWKEMDSVESTMLGDMDTGYSYDLTLINGMDAIGTFSPGGQTGIYSLTCSDLTGADYLLVTIHRLDASGAIQEYVGANGSPTEDGSWVFNVALDGSETYSVHISSPDGPITTCKASLEFSEEWGSLENTGPENLELDTPYDITVINNTYFYGSFTVEKTGIYTITYSSSSSNPSLNVYNEDGSYLPYHKVENADGTVTCSMILNADNTAGTTAGTIYRYNLYGGTAVTQYTLTLHLLQEMEDTKSTGPETMRVGESYPVKIVNFENVGGTFTPEKTGTYSFVCSSCNAEPHVWLISYNNEWAEAIEVEADKIQSSDQTTIYELELEAGVPYTYYLGALSYALTTYDIKVVEGKLETEHNFEEWQTKSVATVFQPKIQTRTCSICGETQTRSVGKALTPTIKTNAKNDTITMMTKTTTSKFLINGLAKGDSIKSVKSSNTKVVKVEAVKSKTGYYKLTAGKTGKAKLTIKLASGYTKKISVTVGKAKVKTTSIRVTPKSVTVKKGKTVKLEVTVSPFNSMQGVAYASANKKIARVSQNGTIKGIKKGKTKIVVASGSKKETVAVVVK